MFMFSSVPQCKKITQAVKVYMKYELLKFLKGLRYKSVLLRFWYCSVTAASFQCSPISLPPI
jgi:hypothetical protein